jgi:cyclophilin family peptidyl-prolyl cis-trans isomerase/HEAT repeat protein
VEPGAAPSAAPLDSRIEATILRQEDRREPGPLRPLLGHADPGVRARAALALGRIGNPSDVEVLAALEADADAGVRGAAAFALGLIGVPEAAAPLRTALADPIESVRAQAACAYGRTGSADSGPLVALVREEHGGDVREALVALWRMRDPATLELVLTRTTDRDPDVRTAAAYCLMRMVGTAGVGATPVPGGTELSSAERQLAAVALIDLATDRDEAIRENAARGLGGPDLPGAAAALLTLLDDPSWRVRVNTLRSLGAIKTGFDPSRLAGALADDNPNVRLAALQALAGIPEAARLSPEVAPVLASGPAPLRAAALAALAAWQGEAFLAQALALAGDGEPQVRAAAAAALGGIAAAEAEARLRALLADRNPAVAVAALTALAARPGADRRSLALEQLQAADFAVRAEAIGMLPKEDAAAAGWLADAWQRALSDNQNDARIAVVEALAAVPGEEARRTLLRIFSEDPDWLVRQRAAAAAPGRDGAPALDPGPVETGRDLAYYEAVLVAARAEKRVALRTTRGTIVLRLFGSEAPLTVASFVDLTSRGYFDGVSFHRVVPNFVVQGGDPRGDGNGGPGYQIRCEINTRRYGRGSVGMALSGKDTGGSQFFITHTPQPHLDGRYTVFAEVVEGMDVVDRIMQGEVILEARVIEEER